MGMILSTERTDNGINMELEVDLEEATMLQGHYNNVHIFSENVAEFRTNISSRGKNSITKYFLIPRELRDNLSFSHPVNCQKIETKDKVIFVYVVNKNEVVHKRAEFLRGE